MVKIFIWLLFFAAALDASIEESASRLASLPAAYRGRFRPADTYARLWLNELYQQQSLKKADVAQFSTHSNSALALLWSLHLQGTSQLNEAPLFYVRDAALKKKLHLFSKRKNRFSYHELKSLSLPEELEAKIDWFEKMQNLPIQYEEALAQLERKGYFPQEIAVNLENQWPLKSRLQSAGDTFLLLPSKHDLALWYSLKALKIKRYAEEAQKLLPVENFTSFSDEQFANIRNLYLQIEQKPTEETLTEQLATAIHEAYASLAGIRYREAFGKALFFPTFWQLALEKFYFEWPLIEIALLLYGIAACASLLSLYKPLPRTLLSLVFLAFAFHTMLLALRCYILMRPPVSNMFETVLYVPWVATCAALLFRKSEWLLLASPLASLALLSLLTITKIDASMENVQAVLDSQYWLIIHVLLIVGSYGLFILCGVLGHCYLIASFFQGRETARMKDLSSYILQAMYLGIALLIPGTILGGVWAAQSWGRFWDWDPKESWALLSSCIYLLFIHAYRFHYIKNIGLSVGAIVGLQAISFTWYGVNYILGTGLHSYGFGSGGELYYYLFLAAEALFLVLMLTVRRDLTITKENL